MVRRPKEWEKWTQEERMKWLRKQRTEYNEGRRVLLSKKDTHRIWSLLKQHENLSLVADLVRVDRTTLWRFLQKHPMPNDFVVKDDMQITDFPEMQIWLKRIEGFAKKVTVNNYRVALRQFYEHMKKKHPERGRPRLWTSDDITEYVYAQPKHLWHWVIVPLRSLALKAQEEFPNINLGLLPTKRTHKAKRSLAGKKEYYFTSKQITNMIEVASTKKSKAIIAFLYNTACRVTGLINVRIENLNLDRHMVKIVDKFSITWLVYGLTEKTCKLLREYLEERDNPKKGWLFINGNNNRLTATQVNDIIEELGQKAKNKREDPHVKKFQKVVCSERF